MPKIKKIDIEKLYCSADQAFIYLWDSSLIGFGVRCTNKGVKSFIVRYRLRGKQKVKTLGRCNVLDLTLAQKNARIALADIAQGNDPFIAKNKNVKTLHDLSIAFQKGRAGELKPKTLNSYESLWRHINKAIGETPVAQLDEISVRDLRAHLSDRPTTYNRCLSLVLSALKWGGEMSENHAFKRAKKFKEKKRQRILSKNENINFYAALREYKEKRKSGWRYADLFILLLLTGLRRDEWRKGRWEWINWEQKTYDIPDNKTGGRVVYLSSYAIAVLEELYTHQKKPKKGFIFPSPRRAKKAPISWTWRLWNTMRRECGLEGFRIHDMRHTAGSIAHSEGKLTQRQVADFLGHARLETSARYIHDNEKREAAEAASSAIAEGWSK